MKTISLDLGLWIVLPEKNYKKIIKIHGCVKSTVIDRMLDQLGRMADFLPPVTVLIMKQ